MFPKLDPLPLLRISGAFDHPDWIFEVKFDGFRAHAYIDGDACELVSRKGITYKRFGDLAAKLWFEAQCDNAIIDGELVCLDGQGRSRFYDLMFGRAQAYFYGFDLLWLDGQDLREWPLLERKEMLRKIVPAGASQLLYLDHIEETGVALYEMCCEQDLEGVVAKPKESPYRLLSGKTPWLKIKNADYSQARGREEMFNGRRGSDRRA